MTIRDPRTASGSDSVAPPARAGAALWLLPTGEPAAELARLIVDLAGEFGTAPFEPHVTLMSGLPLDAGDLLSRAASLADELGARAMSVLRPEESESFYRCVTLRMRDEEPLVEARRLVERRFDLSGVPGSGFEPGFEPHLSVLYAHLGRPLREALVARLHAWAGRGLTAGFLDVMDVDGRPADWRRLARFALWQPSP